MEMDTSQFPDRLSLSLITSGLSYPGGDEPPAGYYRHSWSRFLEDQRWKYEGGNAGCVAALLGFLYRDIHLVTPGRVPIWLTGMVNSRANDSTGFSSIVLPPKFVRLLLEHRDLVILTPLMLERAIRSSDDRRRRAVGLVLWDLTELRETGLIPVQFEDS